MLRRLGRLGYGMPCGREETGSPYLDGVLDSTVFDLDATVEDSYGGTGVTWSNLVASPADGASQTDYDFSFNGSPTFTGSAGDPAAYLALGGSDYFTISGGNTPLTNSMHHSSGTSFWIALAFRTASSLTLTCPFGTHDNTSSGDDGLSIFTRGSGDLRLGLRGDSASSIETLLSGGTVNTSTEYLLVQSYDSDTATVRTWLNTTTADEDSITWPTATNDAEFALALMSRGGGNLAMNSGTRFYAASMGNAFIGNEEAAAIIEHLETRHGRDYTS